VVAAALCVCVWMFFECSSGLGVVIVVAAAAYVLRKVKAISIASLSRGAKQASLSCTEGFHFLRALCCQQTGFAEANQKSRLISGCDSKFHAAH
jgi:hypothetical protein